MGSSGSKSSKGWTGKLSLAWEKESDRLEEGKLDHADLTEIVLELQKRDWRRLDVGTDLFDEHIAEGK